MSVCSTRETVGDNDPVESSIWYNDGQDNISVRWINESPQGQLALDDIRARNDLVVQATIFSTGLLIVANAAEYSALYTNNPVPQVTVNFLEDSPAQPPPVTPTEEPPTEEPPTEEPPTEEPPTEEPPTEAPPTEEPPVETPPVCNQASDSKSASNCVCSTQLHNIQCVQHLLPVPHICESMLSPGCLDKQDHCLFTGHKARALPLMLHNCLVNCS